MAKKTYKILSDFIDLSTGERVSKTQGTFATDDAEQAERLIKAGVLAVGDGKAAAPVAATPPAANTPPQTPPAGGENGGSGAAEVTRQDKIKFLTEKNITVAQNISNANLDALYAEHNKA